MKTFTLFKRRGAAPIGPEDPRYAGQPFEFRFTYRKRRFSRALERGLTKAQAQQRARALYREIVQCLDAERYADLDRTKLKTPASATLGELFLLYDRFARCEPRTKTNNKGALRIILRRGLAQPQLEDEALERLPLTTLTRQLAKAFQDALLRAAGSDYLAQETVKTNANSLLRQAKSLFAARPQNNLLENYADAGLRLPDSVAEFKRTALFPEPDHKFQPPPEDVVRRVHAAAPQLRQTDPEVYKAYLLAYGCGVRRKEIVFLCGSWIRHETGADGIERHAIEYRTRANFQVKNKKTKWVPMEDFVWRELIALKPLLATPAVSDVENYVLDGDERARYDTFKRLGAWMRSQGWMLRKKAHGLRALYSCINGLRFGSDVACRLVGNSRDVFDRHYFGLLNLPAVQMFP